jgi:hypothetical protein
LEDLGVNGRIILKCILRNSVRGCGPDLFASGYRQWQVLVNEPLGFVKGGKFLHQLNDYKFLKKGSYTWSKLIQSHPVSHFPFF